MKRLLSGVASIVCGVAYWFVIAVIQELPKGVSLFALDPAAIAGLAAWLLVWLSILSGMSAFGRSELE